MIIGHSPRRDQDEQRQGHSGTTNENIQTSATVKVAKDSSIPEVTNFSIHESKNYNDPSEVEEQKKVDLAK